MRGMGRAALAAAVALVAGLALSFVVAGAVRSSAPGGRLLSRVAPVPKLAVWTFAAAHGVPVRIEAGAQVDPRIADGFSDRLGDRLGGIIGDRIGDGDVGAGAGVPVRLAPLSLLVLAGLVLCVVIRDGRARPPDVFRMAVTAAFVYGAGLAGLASAAASWTGRDIAIVRAGVGVFVPVAYAFGAGAVWAAVFAAVGLLAVRGVRTTLPPLAGAVGAGLARGLVVASVTTIVALLVLAVAQAADAGGVEVDPQLAAVGAALFAVNVVGAGIVLAHGPPMITAFAAGPFERISQIGYAASGEVTVSPARFVFLMVPVLSLIAAGRVMRRYLPRADAARAAAAFGIAWGVLLAAIALMLRVRVVTTFEITGLQAGGGATINALFAFAAGTLAAAVLSYVGLVTGREYVIASAPVAAEPAPMRTCDACGSAVPRNDSFCGACGRPVASV